MLQSKCHHSNALPFETCSFCNSAAPETLLEICFDYINKHLETICKYDSLSGDLTLMNGLALPVEICERLLDVRCNSLTPVNSNFINIFKNTECTRLKRVRLRKSKIQDRDLEILLQHKLIELDISQSPDLTSNCIKYITEHGSSLLSLSIGENTSIFPNEIYGEPKFNEEQFNQGFIFLAPSLKKLSLRGLNSLQPAFYMQLLNNLSNLTYLDLSSCGDLHNFTYATHLVNLTSLILYNVDAIDKMVPAICKLVNLRHLDISQSRDEHGKYDKGNKILKTIVESLPKLTSLDISGTNLAGRGVAETMNGYVSDIPGLSSRVNNPFQYLGLYETSHDACLRHDIPAKLIAGNANEDQILVAALAYLDRTDMLQKVMNELFHLFRFENIVHVGQALNVVLEAMGRHLHERHIQISGSATLFYIVKSTERELHNDVNVKRKIITTLLNGMSAHRRDDTMMRNGCLTLCQFKIPVDVLFDYERLVNILLHSVDGMAQESFVQRIGIYLLNSLACQVDGTQKVKLGELGAIDKMIWLIKERLERGICDDVLEVAWSTMWNVTDETPENCRKFLKLEGMQHFLLCLEKFPDKEELLRNMMGLLGNVAEVKELRHYLITPEYLSVFSRLLDSRSDGIEVSYNAAGVISHIASDGPEVWNVTEPSRAYVLKKMVSAIDRWNINSQRNINYRSFEPILYLVQVYHTPECQQWAVWALANLTRVYPEKYCTLVEKEGGLRLLQELLLQRAPSFRLRELAAIVLQNCRTYQQDNWRVIVEALEG
ncbi:protein zer-1 homolog isoform X2 [Leptinotarsa decemlineata]|nr:protein zer-1 homolog isoform X2 [Leptinotarsa decemlineata]XP_023018901.1 protein zer-1 homolog isoform X2 [Leptinotarsa decemlineata]